MYATENKFNYFAVILSDESDVTIKVARLFEIYDDRINIVSYGDLSLRTCKRF